jgi:hypothetical protein
MEPTFFDRSKRLLSMWLNIIPGPMLAKNMKYLQSNRTTNISMASPYETTSAH